MRALGKTEAAILAAQHVAAFNDAVASDNFTAFTTLFTDDATFRFEKVPGAGDFEFKGREAYTQAYRDRPPDDKIDIAGPIGIDGATATVPFAWRRDGDTGTMRLTFTDGRPDELDERLVSDMTITFDPPAK